MYVRCKYSMYVSTDVLKVRQSTFCEIYICEGYNWISQPRGFILMFMLVLNILVESRFMGKKTISGPEKLYFHK